MLTNYLFTQTKYLIKYYFIKFTSYDILNNIIFN
jgi:hypothetical protein